MKRRVAYMLWRVLGHLTVNLPPVMVVAQFAVTGLLIADGTGVLFWIPPLGTAVVWTMVWLHIGLPARWARRRQGAMIRQVLALAAKVPAGKRTVYVCEGEPYTWAVEGAQWPHRAVLTRSEMQDIEQVASLQGGASQGFAGILVVYPIDSWYPVIRRKVVAYTIGSIAPLSTAVSEKKVGWWNRTVTQVRLEWYERMEKYADPEEMKGALEYISKAKTMIHLNK